MSYTENVANFMEYSTNDQDSGVSISDLEMVAPEAIQKVRSRPNSPLASRDTSPTRASPASLCPRFPQSLPQHSSRWSMVTTTPTEPWSSRLRS